MRVEKGKVRAPEIGRVWLNSTPLSFRQLRGRVVLVDFWDYTCVNCIRTLPYVQAWHERYRDKGLAVIGVHTPEFTFAQ
jgi:thiol-disulfide isomerase/thioredoxin